ncbi:MAG: EamA family transporter [Candidatus Azambacteria bacterium]|nr:EamA family transporter [Candidatus Azambacteria bacterium]
MQWYIFSFIALITGSFYGLSKKWALNLKMSPERLLLYLFSGAFLAYFLYNFSNLGGLIQKENFSTLLGWGLIIAILSFSGNLLDMYAAKNSPNIAYAESLKSTNAILITAASVFIFSSEISFLKVIGMVIISLGLLPLLLSKSEIKEGQWKLPAFIALFLFAAMILIVRHLGNLDFKAQEILLVLFFFATIFCIFLNLFRGKSYEKRGSLIWLAILVAIISAFIANLANFSAIKLAPNAGYSQAIFNSGIVLTLIISRFVFSEDKGGDFNLLRWLGVLLVVGGVILIVL